MLTQEGTSLQFIRITCSQMRSSLLSTNTFFYLYMILSNFLELILNGRSKRLAISFTDVRIDKIDLAVYFAACKP